MRKGFKVNAVASLFAIFCIFVKNYAGYMGFDVLENWAHVNIYLGIIVGALAVTWELIQIELENLREWFGEFKKSFKKNGA